MTSTIFRYQIALWVLGLLGSVCLRLAWLDFVTDDMSGDMIPWFNYIATHGSSHALSDEIGNYPPLYYYFLAIATWLPMTEFHAIKTVYIVFDYILAGYIWKIVHHRSKNGLVATIAGLGTLFLPTVAMNASLWGQCDAMYTSGIVACVYYTLINRSLVAMIAFGLACSLKPQAVFLFPFLVVLVLKGHLKWVHLLLTPCVYVISIFPAWLAGRSITDLLLLYVHQQILPVPSLSLGATNPYQWLSDKYFSIIFPAGLVLTTCAAISFVMLTWRRNRAPLDDKTLLTCATASLILMPYLLPAMHDRYFFPADVLSLTYACYLRRGWIVMLLVQAASFFTYLPYLFNREPIPRSFLTILMGIALILLLRVLWKSTNESVSDDSITISGPLLAQSECQHQTPPQPEGNMP